LIPDFRTGIVVVVVDVVVVDGGDVMTTVIGAGATDCWMGSVSTLLVQAQIVTADTKTASIRCKQDDMSRMVVLLYVGVGHMPTLFRKGI
jgi:hypothetical protein